MFTQKLDKGVRAINKFNNTLLVVALAGMFVILMLQIISRLTPAIIMPWAQDMIIFLLMASVFLGAGSATQVDKHIRLEFFVHFFKPGAVRIFLIVADALSVVFLGVICYQSIILGIQALRTTTGASPIPLGYYYWVVGFGCLVMLLNFIVLIIKRVLNIPATANIGEYKNGGEQEK